MLVLVSLSCKEQCLDVEFINNQTNEMTTWFTDATITLKLANSSINISDEVLLSHEFFDYGDSIWDDCDGVSQSFRNTTNYRFFNFPIQLSTEFYKQGEENGFYFYVNYNYNNGQNYNWIQQSYNFTKEISSPRNSITRLTNFEFNNEELLEVLKVDFPSTNQPTQLKTLYFAKEKGVIRLLFNNNVVVNLI